MKSGRKGIAEALHLSSCNYTIMVMKIRLKEGFISVEKRVGRGLSFNCFEL
jgi:hypothetical protein